MERCLESVQELDALMGKFRVYLWEEYEAEAGYWGYVGSQDERLGSSSWGSSDSIVEALASLRLTFSSQNCPCHQTLWWVTHPSLVYSG